MTGRISQGTYIAIVVTFELVVLALAVVLRVMGY